MSDDPDGSDDLDDRLDELADDLGADAGEAAGEEPLTFEVWESEAGPDGEPTRVGDEPAYVIEFGPEGEADE